MSLRESLIHGLSRLYPMAKRWLKRFPGGVYPAYRKELSARHPLHEPILPKELILPLQQHVGVSAIPTVKPGERVLKYQQIAKPAPGLSVPVHAPTSGVIKAIEKRPLPHPSGLPDWCIIIEPDGEDEAGEMPVAISTPTCPASLKEMILQAGIVGMGGAGFPSWSKLPAEKGQIHTLLINGAECEPYITCDDLLMQTRPDQIIAGAQRVAECIGAEKIIVGIEDNKPTALKAMRKAAAGSGIEIQAVPTVYPMGGQKQLTEQLTGIEVPAKAHAVDVGLLMFNVATVAAIHRAAQYHEPLISRLVTVSGEGLGEPMNIEALLGTPFEALVQLAKPRQPLDYPLIMGGPMMGHEVVSPRVPVIKTTNCILANPPQPVTPAMPCIRCGECMDACPVNLLPQQMYWHAHAHEWAKVEKLHLFDCIECGCCSFVCPSHIPLVQYYRHAKGEIRKIREEEAFQEHARRRHEAHLARLEREKAEKAARLKAKKEAVKKQATTTPQDAGTSGPLSARERAIAAARARAAKEEAYSDQADAATTKRKAAMEAAQARAARKKDGADRAEQSSTASAQKRKAAMEAARRRAQTLKEHKRSDQVAAEQAPAEKTDEVPSASDRLQAAREAARKRAAALREKKEPADSAPSSTSTESAHVAQTNPAESDTSLKERRKAAMEAARRRAAARRKQHEQRNDTLDALDSASAAENTLKTPHTSLTEGSENQLEKAAAEKVGDPPAADRRKAAMEAARRRAAALRARKAEQTQQDES